MRVLLIEDHRVTRDMIADHLRGRGFAVDAVRRGDEAMAARALASYDAVILDLGLPDIDGRDLLPQLRSATGGQPILIVTARDSIEQRLGGLNAGADDFIRKPFHLLELEARLRAVLRRPGTRRDVHITHGDIRFDSAARTATVAGEALALTRREATVLECLIERGGSVVPRDVLDQQLYGFDDDVSGNALEAVISRLRRRVAQAGSSSRVEAVRGIGYRLTGAGDA